MKESIISVVMITYNHEKYIQQAIEGVLMQQANFPIELIIADDASLDQTEKIVNKIKVAHPNGDLIKYTKHKTNKGMMLNFIWALNQAQGKYVAICEGDDYWTDPYKLQKQVFFLEENPEYVVCGTYCDTERYGKLEKTTPKGFKFIDNLDIIVRNGIPTLTMLFRNNYIDYNTLRRYPTGDTALLLELTKNGKKIAKLNENTAVYRYHGKGVNSGNSRYYNTKINYKTKHIFAKESMNIMFLWKLKKYFFFNSLKETKYLLFNKSISDFRILLLSLRYLIKI